MTEGLTELSSHQLVEALAAVSQLIDLNVWPDAYTLLKDWQAELWRELNRRE